MQIFRDEIRNLEKYKMVAKIHQKRQNTASTLMVNAKIFFAKIRFGRHFSILSFSRNTNENFRIFFAKNFVLC